MRNATKEVFPDQSRGDVAAKRNDSKELKENLEADEYIQLLETPMFNEEIRKAFIFSCYNGFRFCDVSILHWEQFEGNKITTRIIQLKIRRFFVVKPR